ncbi:MAG: hypothetical protein ACPG19_08915 [Saprospiraceae bacterium]
MKTGEYKTPDINPNEAFKLKSKKLDFNITDFWKWTLSDLVENRNRGILAEFIVKEALQIKSSSRIEWDSYDFETVKGVRIEVKSSAYIQSWKQNEYSTISFNIKPTHKYTGNNQFSEDKKRQSDVYIFCILAHQNFNTINPMCLEQWEFYMIKTKTLDKELKEQQTIRISTLEIIGAIKCDYNNLKKEFDKLEQELSIN